jgi:small-conductance mechanosensitive channel
VLLAIFIVACAYGVATAIAFILGRLSERLPSRRLFFKRLQPIPQIGVYAIAGYLAIKILSPEQTSLYAILGSMALALGLAAQDLLKDLIGGIVVLVDKPFQIGDRIRAGDFYGEVTAIGLRSTKIRTSQKALVTLPNSQVLSAGVSNTNAGAVESLVTTHIYMPAHVDLVTIETIAREAVLTSKGAYLKQPITILVSDEFADNHVTHLEIRAYVFDSRYESNFVSDITHRIRLVMLEKGLLSETSEGERGIDMHQLDTRIHGVMAEQLMALGRHFAQRHASGVR